MADELTILDLAQDLGKDVLNSVKDDLGGEWDLLTDVEKETLERNSKKYMELKLREKLGEDVSEQLAAVDSVILDFRTQGAIAVSAAFVKGVQQAGALLGAFLLGNLPSILPSS